MRKKFRKILKLATPLVAGFGLCASSIAVTVYPPATDAVIPNPHRGFMLWGSVVKAYNWLPANYYDASVYHVYLPWRMMEPKDNVFDWETIEQTYFKPITDRNPNATFVIRPVADYPGGTKTKINYWYRGANAQSARNKQQASGVAEEWLLGSQEGLELDPFSRFSSHGADHGAFKTEKPTVDDKDYPLFFEQYPVNIPTYGYSVCRHKDDGMGYTPDWNSPAFARQSKELIKALGERYDGDPRITAVQMGLLGLWGEWHQADCPSNIPVPGEAIKKIVVDAYAEAFTKTPLQVRYAGAYVKNTRSGFHEDYFPSFTGQCNLGLPLCNDTGSWSLEWGMQNLAPKARNYWKNHPISGESPLVQQKDTWINHKQSSVIKLLRDYHFSFLGPAGKHEEPGYADKLAKIQNNLGYRFQINKVSYPANIHHDNTVKFVITISQQGSAPTYFPTNIVIDWVHHGTDQVMLTSVIPSDLKSLMPGKEMTLVQEVPIDVLSQIDGVFSLRMSMMQPGQTRRIRFANGDQDAQGRINVGDISLIRAKRASF